MVCGPLGCVAGVAAGSWLGLGLAGVGLACGGDEPSAAICNDELC